MAGLDKIEGANHPGMERAEAYGSYVGSREPAPKETSYIRVGSKSLTAQELANCIQRFPAGTFKMEDVIEKCYGMKPVASETPKEPAGDGCRGKQCDW